MTHFALYPLHSLLSVTAEYSGWHPAQRHWEIHKGESSLIPGSPLRTALISRRLWLVGLCLICFIPLPLCRKKGCLPVPRFGCEVHQTHTGRHTKTRKNRRTKIYTAADFSCLLETLQVASETQYHTPADSYTHANTHVSCSAPNQRKAALQ